MDTNEFRSKTYYSHPKHEVQAEDLVACVYFKDSNEQDLAKEYLARRRPIPTDGTVMFEVDGYGRLVMDCEQGFNRKQIFIGEGVSYEAIAESYETPFALSNTNHKMKRPIVWKMGNDHYDPLVPRQCFKISDNNNLISSVAHSAVQRHFCLLYTSPSPRDKRQSRMPSSA